MNKNFKDIYHAYTTIVDEFYIHISDLEQNFKKEDINKKKINNKAFFSNEFEGLNKIPEFVKNFKDFLKIVFKDFKKNLINDPFHKKERMLVIVIVEVVNIRF